MENKKYRKVSIIVTISALMFIVLVELHFPSTMSSHAK